MNTELDLNSLLIILHGLKHYNDILDLDLKKRHYCDMDDQANLADKAKENQNLLKHANEVYAFKHEQVYGEPHIRFRWQHRLPHQQRQK